MTGTSRHPRPLISEPTDALSLREEVMSSTGIDPWFVVDPREVPKMAQHGQVLKL